MNRVCLYTTQFPYGKGETFLENEIPLLATKFDEVHIFPMSISETERKMPDNVKVHFIFSDFDPNADHKKLFLTNFFTVLYVFYKEIIWGRVYKKQYKNKFHYILSYFGRTKVFFEYLKKENLVESAHYAYWFDTWVNCLTILNLKRKLKFTSRVHGYDLYEERVASGYIHFRDMQLKKAHEVYSVSKAGQEYLQKRYPKYKNKVKVSYLGTKDYGAAPVPTGEKMRIVSCSNVIELKRINLIIEVLKNLQQEIEWVHFGDGKLFEEIKEQAKELPANVTCNFMGRKTNAEVIQYYKKTEIDFFINLSDTEGLPVSIMEAISFGIPVVATNVGGTSEIVNEPTGVVVDKEFAVNEVASIIEKNKERFRDQEFRTKVRKFWLNNFEASGNYSNFHNILADE